MCIRSAAWRFTGVSPLPARGTRPSSDRSDRRGCSRRRVSLSMSSNRSMPAGASTPCSTMSLNSACSPALSRRRSGVMLRPSAWQREHSSTNLTSPASMAALLAVCARRLLERLLERAGGVGTAPPPSFKAMMRLVFWILQRRAARRDGAVGDAGAAVADLHGDVLLAVHRIGRRRRHDVAAVSGSP